MYPKTIDRLLSYGDRMKNLAFATCLICVLLAFLYVLVLQCHLGYAVDEKSMITQAQAIDKVFEAGVTFTASVTANSIVNTNSFSTYSVFFTRAKGGFVAIKEDTGAKITSSQSESDSSMYAVFPVKQVFFTDSQRAVTQSISPIAEGQSESENTNVLVTDADAGCLDGILDTYLLAIGRNVVGPFVSISESKLVSDDEGIKHLLLSGTEKSGATWEVDILPDAGFLLRKASFFNDRGQIEEVLETEGQISNDGVFFPQKARISKPLGNHSITKEFLFTDVKLGFDSIRYTQIKDDLSKEYEAGVTVKDETKGQSVTYVVGGHGHSEYVSRPPHSFFQRFLFIGIVNLLGIALICYLAYRDRQNKMEQKSSPPRRTQP